LAPVTGICNDDWWLSNLMVVVVGVHGVILSGYPMITVAWLRHHLRVISLVIPAPFTMVSWSPYVERGSRGQIT
jgi:hypothetical protein